MIAGFAHDSLPLSHEQHLALPNGGCKLSSYYYVLELIKVETLYRVRHSGKALGPLTLPRWKIMALVRACMSNHGLADVLDNSRLDIGVISLFSPSPDCFPFKVSTT